jgi:hypothetical protein
MVSTLTQLLIAADQLPPSERKKKIVAFALSHFRGAQLLAVRQELDEKLELFHIVPRDYALLLHASESLSWALDILKTSPHPAIVTTAVDIVGKAWRKDPLAVKTIFGGEGSNVLVQLIDTHLPRYATARLFKSFGTVPRVSSAHSSTVDDILEAIFPFLSKDRPTPLTRYARSAVVVLFTAASPSVVMAIVQRCATWFTEATWKRLTESRPDLVEDILLRQVNPVETLFDTSSDDIVVKKGWNRVIMWALLRNQKDSTFFTRFLNDYASRTLQNKEAPDLFGVLRSGRSTVLFEFMAFILRKRTVPDKMLTAAIAFCETMMKLVDAGACDEWTWDSARPLLEIACHEFGKSPDEWSLAKIDVSKMQTTATGFLLVIFKKQTYPANTFEFPSSTLIHLLRRLPLPARLPFLNLLYATKASESLVETPNNRATYPKFAPFLLSLLSPAHGRAVFEVGTKALAELFINQGYYSRSKQYDFSRLPADAISPMLFANWAGIEGTLRDHTAELGPAENPIVRDVEAYKNRAMRSRDDRPNLVKAALLLPMISRCPSLFVDTLSWAVKRYAKDPETSPAILSWLTGQDRYTIDFLSGPVGIYASHRTRGKLTMDMLLAWCAKTNEVFGLLIELLSVWVMEPGFGSIMGLRHESVGTLLFSVIEGRSGKLVSHHLRRIC